jgi:hypothetical protein
MKWSAIAEILRNTGVTAQPPLPQSKSLHLRYTGLQSAAETELVSTTVTVTLQGSIAQGVLSSAIISGPMRFTI